MVSDLEVNIRTFRAADLEEVIEMERKCFSDPWPGILFSRIGGKNPEGFKVAVFDSEVIGYVLGRTEEKDEKTLGHLLNLAVEKKFRRRGIGSKLITEIEVYFRKRNAEGAWLEVREDNQGARKFYLYNEYRKIDYVKDYYPNGDDAIIMGRKFSEELEDLSSLDFE